ncbi:MAG: M42 family peptidase [Oscillospiraceae bacterium]|jgi:endoglucanase|nr:M42 family peptidase [Oscillospiraceae bacterium]
MNFAWLERLCSCGGISGREDAVRGLIISLLPQDAAHETDPLGNLIVTKPGAARGGKRVMLCAHMDEVGLIVTEVTGDGFLRFAHVGGIDRRAYLGKAVLVGRRALPGVIGLKPTHLVEGDQKKAVPPQESLAIDIGAASKEEAQALVSLGDAVSFAPGFVRFGEGFIKSKAIDDRFGCLVLLELLHEALPYDLTAVFSCQEEIGGAAGAAAYRLAPDAAVVVETTTASDLPGFSGAERVCSLGGGAVVPFMDGGAVYPFHLYARTMALARERGIPVQTKTKIAGGNDARAVSASRAGIPVVAVSLPCRSLHSPSTVMLESDAEAVYALVRALWEDLSA